MKDLPTFDRTADEIGVIRAKIAELREEQSRLEGLLIDQGAGAYEGELYRITITLAERTTTAWKKIAEKLGASRQMITANSSTTEYTSLRCFARNTERKAA